MRAIAVHVPRKQNDVVDLDCSVTVHVTVGEGEIGRRSLIEIVYPEQLDIKLRKLTILVYIAAQVRAPVRTEGANLRT